MAALHIISTTQVSIKVIDCSGWQYTYLFTFIMPKFCSGFSLHTLQSHTLKLHALQLHTLQFHTLQLHTLQLHTCYVLSLCFATIEGAKFLNLLGMKYSVTLRYKFEF